MKSSRPSGWDTHFDDLETLIETDLSAPRHAAQRASRRIERLSDSAILQ